MGTDRIAMSVYLLFYGRLNKEAVLYFYSLTNGMCNVYCYLFKMKKNTSINPMLTWTSNCEVWSTYKTYQKLGGGNSLLMNLRKKDYEANQSQ